MKLLVFVLLCASFVVVFAETKVKPPEPPPEDENKASATPRDYTKEELEFIKQVHRDMPDLPPDTFKIVETSFRKKLTEEEKAERKRQQEKKAEYEQRQDEKELDKILLQSRENIKSMKKEEVEKVIEDLAPQLAEVEEKIKKQEL